MMQCSLIRMDYKTGNGTVGVLLIEGLFYCLTLERPFLYNIRNNSCIPVGIYYCIYASGEKTGYLLQEVSGRSGIMIHAGNTINDTTGCILLGKGIEIEGNVKALTNSRKAVAGFENRLMKKSFALTIWEYDSDKP